MFKICDGKGFYVKLENGYTISCQFGPRNYCEHYDEDSRNTGYCGKHGSVDAEFAVINPNGDLIEIPMFNGDTVAGYKDSVFFVELINYVNEIGKMTNENEIVNGIMAAIDVCHGASVKGGWWNDIHTGAPLQRNRGELLMLIVSEIAEAMEGERKNLMDSHLPDRPSVEVELADALIRIFDYAGGFKLDLAGAVIDKLAYNAKRADHKVENRAKENGKRF